MELLIINLTYFGAFLIPLAYLLLKVTKRIEGSLWKEMGIGIILQLLWSLGVWGFVYYSWKEGYSEYYWGWALLIPVNFVALIWYSTCPFWSRIYKKQEAYPDAVSNG